MEFFQQLKQRRLFRIVIAYLAGGWVALQVMDQVTGHGILPGFAYDLTLIWYVAGMPIALVVGWYHGEKGVQRVVRREMVLLVLFLAGGVVASVPVVSREMRRRMRLAAASETKLDLRRVAVLYFEDRSPRDSLRYLADGFTGALIDRLSAVPELHVVSRNGVRPYRDHEVSPDSVARALEAGTLVRGSVDEEGGRIRVSVSLIDGGSGAEFQHTGFSRPADELLAARDDLADRTARLLRRWLGEEVELRHTRDETRSVTAWALYQRGERALEDAEEAIAARRRTALSALDRADSLAARSALVDSTWPRPPVLRARIAYRHALEVALGGDREGAVAWIRTGLEQADRALDLDRNDAQALRWRGSLEYLHNLLHVESDPDREAALLTSAQTDLQRATDLDPNLAGAYAMLSHLYATRDDAASQLLAARRAYEADAYLRNADKVVQTIFEGSYNLRQFAEAGRWCDLGRKRFPDEVTFTTCQLYIMDTPAGEPNPPRAWRLAARVDSLAPRSDAGFDSLQAELLAGGVLARAGFPDSARRVLTRALRRATPEVDEDRQLHLLGGYLSTLAGDTAEALSEIRLWSAVHPGKTVEAGWWFEGLRGDPRFERIVAQAAGSP